MQESDAEVVVQAGNVGELFRRREFDPLTADPDSLCSIPEVAELGEAASHLSRMRLRIRLPHAQISPETAAVVHSAMQRYCAHKIGEAKVRLIAWRRTASRAFLVGFGFFVLSLAATAAVKHLAFLPEEVQTIASETLIIAGWIFMWQPLDDLIQGWWPIWEQARTFKAIGAMPLVVEGVD